MAKKILIISAHPDDETIGMGGAMLKHRAAGDALYWLILTDAVRPKWSQKYIDQKELEIKAIAKFFGITKTFRSHFPTMHLNALSSDVITDAISKIITGVRPDVVYCPPPNDINSDHRAAFQAALVATRPLLQSSVREFIAYEIPVTTRFVDAASGNFFVPNLYMDISRFLKKKIQAFKLYKTEARSFPHPRSPKGLEILARERGLAIAHDAAEAFISVRSSR